MKNINYRLDGGINKPYQQENSGDFCVRIGFLIDGEICYIDSKELQKAAQNELKNMAFIDVLKQLASAKNGN